MPGQPKDASPGYDPDPIVRLRWYPALRLKPGGLAQSFDLLLSHTRPPPAPHQLANAKAFFAQFGLGPETEDAAFVALWFPAQISVPMHHGAATAFAFSAYSFGSSGLLRVALSFEIAENVLHYAQMAWTALRPDRGVAPWRFCDRKTWAFVGLVRALRLEPQARSKHAAHACARLRAAAQHHLLGLVAGSAAFLSPSVCAWPELQLFVAMVLAAGLPSFLKLPLQVCADLSQPSLLGVAGAAIDVLGMAYLSWVRLGWGPRCYLPMARALVERCREDEGCAEWFYAVPLYYVFPVFNLMRRAPPPAFARLAAAARMRLHRGCSHHPARRRHSSPPRAAPPPARHVCSVVILAPYVFTQVRAQFTGPAPRKLS